MFLRTHTAAVQPDRPDPQGFTLIELLVVLAIVSILAALLATALPWAMRAAKSAGCKSNLRQLGLALRMYVDEHDRYPAFSAWDGQRFSFWPDALAPFLSQKGVAGHLFAPQPSSLKCPGSTAAGLPGPRIPVNYGYTGTGYAYQGLGEKLVLAAGAWKSASVQETDVLQPADTLALGDGIERQPDGALFSGGISLERWQLQPPDSLVGGIDWTPDQIRGADFRVRKLHGGRANVSFCDGHVEADRLRLLFEDTTDRALQRWNRDHAPHREYLR